MARGRILSKSLSCSRRFNALIETQNGLAEFSQLLFALLIPHTDDFGRMTGDPFSVKMTVMPASPRTFDEFCQALHALHDSELVTIYQRETSDIWLQINKFDDHQSGLHKRTESKIPPPKKDVPRKFPEIPGNSWSRARAEENRNEGKGTEGNGIEKRGTGVISNMEAWMNDPAPLPETEHQKTTRTRKAMAQSMKRPNVSSKRR